MKLLKRILTGCIVTASCLLVFSCNHSVVSDEIAFTCANGNSIVYDWGFFGDASVFYKESSGEKEKLCDYLYADSNERMEIKVSDDSRIVSLFIHDSTDTEKYPLSVFLSEINSGEVGVAFAVAVIYMIPTLLMFLWGEEYLEEGIAYSGGIKG